MENKGVFDQIFKGLGDAITDIREKAVEEAWYGRVVNERDATAPQWPQAREAEPPLASSTQTRDVARDEQQDLGMDR